VAGRGGAIAPAGSDKAEAAELGTLALTVSTVANIGPGVDFYFAFGVIALTAGIAAPLTILAAALAVALLASTMAEFTKIEPSSGSFITFVESGLGERAGVATALLVTVGYIVAMAGVFAMAGGMVTETLTRWASVTLPWGPLTVVLTLGAIWLTSRGTSLSNRALGIALAVQVAVMVGVCAVVLVDERSHLSGTPFAWSHLTGGLHGLSAGFPLALYMFIGWENGPALAERCRDPKRTVPRALFISIVVGTILFVLFTYATVTGFQYRISSIERSTVPFLTVADGYVGRLALLAWIAGIVSVLAALVAGASSQAQMLYDGGRTGLLPKWMGRDRGAPDSPVNALATMAVLGLGIIGGWWVVRVASGSHGQLDPVSLYAECSTMGTIVILAVYLLTSVALPVFMWRRHRDRFSVVRHLVVPILGSLTLVVPFVELCKPGQPQPYSTFPFVALGVVAVAVVAAFVVVHRHPNAGEPEAATPPAA
jgi:amino acid transporter